MGAAVTLQMAASGWRQCHGRAGEERKVGHCSPISLNHGSACQGRRQGSGQIEEGRPERFCHFGLLARFPKVLKRLGQGAVLLRSSGQETDGRGRRFAVEVGAKNENALKVFLRLFTLSWQGPSPPSAEARRLRRRRGAEVGRSIPFSSCFSSLLCRRQAYYLARRRRRKN